VKARLIVCGAPVILVAAMMWAQAPASDPMIQAMHDEIERAKKLTFNNLEPPYFIQYLVDQSENLSITATLGGLVSRHRDTFREPEIRIRVGDYKFDNSNFAGGFGLGSRYDVGRLPIENSYPVMRRFFWLETDSAYKAAVEAISRKRAALRNLSQADALADFAHADPVHAVHDFQKLTVDEDGWSKRVRALSAIFAKYPEIKNSGIEFDSSVGGYTIVNSEGTEVRVPENVTYLRARAIAQSTDGATLRDAVTFHSFDPMRMPGDAEMSREITALAEHVTALAHAPRGEDYSGPVLFEGVAGAQVFAEILGKNLALTRRPVSGGGRGGGGFTPSELEGRIGARVLPETFDVVDDPTQKEWRGRPLFGSYEVDREGVTPKPLRLVEKGVLKNYLLTRLQVRGFEVSNGHARLPGAFGSSIATLGNLFVTSSEGVAPADLKKKLIELLQTRGRPYGILVRKMDYPSTATVDEARRLITAAQGSRPVSIPLLAYKVYPDWREELIRAMRFGGFITLSFKDILAAGNDANTFEFMEDAAPFSLVGGDTFTAEACVIAPSILIDDLEMHPIEEEQPKLPIVPPPSGSN